MNNQNNWLVEEDKESRLWLAQVGTPKSDSFVVGEEWDSKIAFHYFRDKRKMPLVVASYSFNNPIVLDHSGHGHYIYFFEPEGKGDLIRGHYVGFSGPGWDTSNYKISTRKLPQEIKEKLLSLPPEELELINSLNREGVGLENNEILARFGKGKRLIESYSKGSIFYDKAQRAMQEDPSVMVGRSLHEPSEDSDQVIFNHEFCKAVGITLEKMVDEKFKRVTQK